MTLRDDAALEADSAASTQFSTEYSAAVSTIAHNEREGMHGCNAYLLLCLLVSLKCAPSVRLRIATGGLQAQQLSCTRRNRGLHCDQTAAV